MKDVIVITPLGPLKGLNCLVLIVLISHGSTHAPGKIDPLLSRVLNRHGGLVVKASAS